MDPWLEGLELVGPGLGLRAALGPGGRGAAGRGDGERAVGCGRAETRPPGMIGA